MSLELFQKYNRLQQKPLGPLVPGIHAVQHKGKIYHVKSVVSHMWGLGHTRSYNPAPQPVSLSRADLPLLHHNYMVAEKTDGTRYQLLATRYPDKYGGAAVCLLISRKYEMYEIPVIAPESYFEGTLFDGELVWEYEKGRHIPPRQVFLAFDVIWKAGTSTSQLPRTERLQIIKDSLDTGTDDIILAPRNWLEKASEWANQGRLVSEGNQYALTFRCKSDLPAKYVGETWQNRDKLKHRSDGLIFTPMTEPIKTGTAWTTFKWKPHHTIDLLWKAEFSAADSSWQHTLVYLDGPHPVDATREGIWLRDPEEVSTDKKHPYTRVPLVLIPSAYLKCVIQWHEQHKEIRFQHVVECNCTLPRLTEYFDDNSIPMVECTVSKLRHDKETPNNRRTIERALFNMAEKITIRDLIDICATP